MNGDILTKYGRMAITPDEAVAHIRSGWRVFVGSGCAAPQELVAALCRGADRLNDVELIQLLTYGDAAYLQEEFAGHFRYNSFFISKKVRQAVCEGRADYTPIFLSEIPELIRSGQRGNQAMLLQVSPPDSHGYCSMGVSVDIQRAALDRAQLVIAQINPRMPRTHGDAQVHLSQLHHLVAVDSPILELEIPEPDEVALQIGYHISRLVENGSCLQMGIGTSPAPS